MAQAKKKRLTVTWSTRCKRCRFGHPFDAVFDTSCPGNERCDVVFRCRIAAVVLLLVPLVIFMITVCKGHRLHSQYLSRLGESIARSSSPCCQIGDIFEPARRFADWSTSRNLFPLIVRIGNLGVLAESLRAISLAIRVLEPVTVLRSFSSSTPIPSDRIALLFWSENALFAAQAKLGGKNYINEKKVPIYTAYGNIYTTFGLGVRHTGYPGRPARPGFSAGVLRPLHLGELGHFTATMAFS
jgi:hypothetical protein